MLTGPVQVAYAVDEVGPAVAAWEARGVGPFITLEHIALTNVRVRGEPGTFDHSSAYAQWGEVMVELICQHDGGPDPLVGTAGVHHMAFFVEDFAAASYDLEQRGFAPALYAETTAGMSFAFHDARAELGHLIEIYEPTDRLLAFYAQVRAMAGVV